MNIIPDIWQEMSVRHPLIYHLTNNVASNFSANVSLAIGASPIMSLCPGEAAELASKADGLVINIGTPSGRTVAAMRKAIPAAIARNAATILDPVGYGVSVFRTETVDSFLRDYRFSVVKGNGAEISVLAGKKASQRGVDAVASTDLSASVSGLAVKYSSIIVATGAVDIVSDGRVTVEIRGGHPLLTRITASGCIVGSVICACCAASGNHLWGTLAALVAVDIASERAASVSAGTGSFQMNFLDMLSVLSAADLAESDKRIRKLEVYR